MVLQFLELVERIIEVELIGDFVILYLWSKLLLWLEFRMKVSIGVSIERVLPLEHPRKLISVPLHVIAHPKETLRLISTFIFPEIFTLSNNRSVSQAVTHVLRGRGGIVPHPRHDFVLIRFQSGYKIIIKNK